MDTCIYKDKCTLLNTETCSNTCIRYMEMSFLLNSSNLPKNMQKQISLYPDTCDYHSFIKLKEIKSSIKQWVDSNEFNLLIYSKGTGNGKTSWAIKLLLKYFDEVWAGNGLQERGLFLYVPQFVSKLKDFNNKDLQFEKLKSLIDKVDVIVWDDISSIKLSDYDNTQLLNYIDQRILSGKTNIFTSNLDQVGMQKTLGNRLTSRVWNNSIKIELKGKDRRGGIID